MGERVISANTVFAGRLISVRVDQVELPEGAATTREVVVHPGSVAIVPLLPEGKVVMIKQYRHPAGKVLYELPAGTRQGNEPPEECARRELAEEIGYRAAHLKRLFSMYLSPGYCTEQIHIFLATGLRRVRRARSSAETEPDESIEPVVLTLNEALAMIAAGEVENAAAVAGLLAVAAGVNTSER